MRVIPGSSIRSRIEGVSERLSRWYRAHRNTRDTVFPFGVLLKKSVPVESSTFRWTCDLIVYGHLDFVAPVGFDKGLRWFC